MRAHSLRHLPVFLLCFFFFAFALPTLAFAGVGDMGFFGGISEGRKLPKTTELLLAQTAKAGAKTARPSLLYKELMFLSGVPVEFTGVLDVTATGGVTDAANLGTYTETYKISPSPATDANASVSRAVVFTVNWRREGSQIIKDYTVKSWTETVTTPGGSFALDPRQSSFGISIIEDHTPGVTYYRGDVSARAVYREGVTTESTGSFYGYDCAWSATETHRADVTVTNAKAGWSMAYQIRPSVTVSKTLQYMDNEPLAISFDGNYKEVMQNVSGLKYDVFVAPRIHPDIALSGGANITTRNTFEQLIAPDLSFLKGHFAEGDINKLFSMQVLTGDPALYRPGQAITRGQYVTALVRAVKLPVTMPETAKKGKKAAAPPTVFSDVPPERPEYPFIMAAYNSGLAVGKDGGKFCVDSPIDRQEAIAIMIRVLGLTNVAPNPAPITIFADDADMAAWAKREIYAAYKLGLIGPDDDGRLHPQAMFSKADAAALLNHLIEYMRSGLALDYADHIVNYTK